MRTSKANLLLAREKRLSTPWVNPLSLFVLRREKEDSTISLRKEKKIPVRADQLLCLIKMHVEGRLEDSWTLKVVMLVGL